jgi:hypothetical protein
MKSCLLSVRLLPSGVRDHGAVITRTGNPIYQDAKLHETNIVQTHDERACIEPRGQQARRVCAGPINSLNWETYSGRGVAAVAET